MSDRTRVSNVLDVFEEKDLVKICAPMVRYSKLQFRTLVRNYDCDLCYTPMIMADSFRQSAKARSNEFTTSLTDAPVVAQFAANNVGDFVGAAKLISRYCGGVDLNCGCPQRWAKHLGVGCVLLEKPELIQDLITQCRNQIPRPFTVSVKIRILKNLKKTVELCRQLDHCGASYLSVHSRTSSQLTGEINVEALKLIIQNVNCPVVANGGITTLSDCIKLQQETNCRGVMVANGLLTNPTLFSGTNKTTVHCVQNWVDICFNSTLNSQSRASFRKNHKAAIPEKPPNLTFQCFHHHLVFMLEKTLSKGRRRIFNNLQKFEDVLQFLEDEFAVVPRLFGEEDFENNRVSSLEYADESCKTEEYPGIYDYESSSGRYFESRIEDEDVTEEEYSLADIFTDN